MISKEDIIATLSPLNFWGREQMIGNVRETYLSELRRFSKVKNKVIAILGVRRSGKTTLAKQFLAEQRKEHTLYVNFEDPKFGPYLGVELLDEIMLAYKSTINPDGLAYVVLDEVQNISSWERWVRIQQERRENIVLIVTGSSSKLLSSEIATVLTGRSLKLQIFPLSFKEFLSFKRIHLERDADKIIHKDKIRLLLPEYLQYGGFPEIIFNKEKLLILKDYFEGIIMRDIVVRYKIEDAVQAKITAELALNSFSSLISANKLRNVLVGIVKKKISPNTVVNLLSYFEDAQLLFQVPLLSYKIKEQKLYPKKLYCIDTGLLNAVSTNFSKNKGRLIENVVAVELKRRGREIYYWKDANSEVDFVVKENMKPVEVINVCAELNDNSMGREVRGLAKAMEEFKVRKGTIITENYEKIERNISFVPLWKYLLTE